MPTHYDVLGVRPGATAEEIRRAYRHQARAHHPDAQQVGGERPVADADPRGRRMAAINTAWEVLGDPAKRRRYDADLGLRPPVEPGPPGHGREKGEDDGWHPFHEAEDDLDLDDLDDDVPTGPRRPSDVLVMSPVLLLGAAIGTFFFSNMSQSSGLRTLSILMVPIAALGFVAAPLFAMIRSRSRS